DARVYSRLAVNLLEQHAYSADEGPPYAPTYIRLPGYPLFLAAVYAAFGHGNDAAARTAQALLDTASCLFVAALAFLWQPVEARKGRAAALALALAVVCPFTVIYTATILTETLTIFLALALTLAATLALRARSSRAQLLWWAVAGLCAGSVIMVRPDGGLFAAGAGVTLVLAYLFDARASRADSNAESLPNVQTETRAGVRLARRLDGVSMARRLVRAFAFGSVFAAATVLLMLPWTIRNERVFQVFQPLAPFYATMPDEFVPRGYHRWVRTWIDDPRYIDPLLWKLDQKPIRIGQIPDKAFDSPEERARVAALLDRYNQTPPAAQGDNSDDAEKTGADSDKDGQDENEAGDDGNDEDESSDDSGDDQQDEDEGQGSAESQNVRMTPEIDAEFARLADERVRRAPARYYLWLPLKRAAALWFDTHSDFYAFNGELLPLEDLDYDLHQQFWLPLFAGLTWVYTLLGVAGAWALWRGRRAGAWKWLALALLLTIPRLAFMSTLENPEPRYVVELFPFLAALGGVALASLRLRRTQTDAQAE
ncbi:MAG: glycosyltransferase family 39 protein, partial [Acidobacteriota bacterium]|nr:glycosyltransferase family 39 protein [Acidobacteriota bacterium]